MQGDELLAKCPICIFDCASQLRPKNSFHQFQKLFNCYNFYSTFIFFFFKLHRFKINIKHVSNFLTAFLEKFKFFIWTMLFQKWSNFFKAFFVIIIDPFDMFWIKKIFLNQFSLNWNPSQWFKCQKSRIGTWKWSSINNFVTILDSDAKIVGFIISRFNCDDLSNM